VVFRCQILERSGGHYTSELGNIMLQNRQDQSAHLCVRNLARSGAHYVSESARSCGSYVSEWVRSEGHYASGSASSGAHIVSESARSVVLQDWMLIMRQNV
jgi:hypothetical protein